MSVIGIFHQSSRISGISPRLRAVITDANSSRRSFVGSESNFDILTRSASSLGSASLTDGIIPVKRSIRSQQVWLKLQRPLFRRYLLFHWEGCNRQPYCDYGKWNYHQPFWIVRKVGGDCRWYEQNRQQCDAPGAARQMKCHAQKPIIRWRKQAFAQACAFTSPFRRQCG